MNESPTSHPPTGHLAESPPLADRFAKPDSSGDARAGDSTKVAGFIGKPGQDVLAIAFEGGAFDTAMQFGVIHALLITDRRAPDVVVGISAGAIHAAGLAEVLQAGAEECNPEVRRLAQIRRFREYLDAFQRAPEVLVRSILPDGLEISAATALEPVRLPIHFEEEREHRREAVEARAGMTQLMNHLFAVKLPFSAITLAVRRILGIQAAGDAPSWVTRRMMCLRQGAGLWRLAIWNCVWLTPLVRMLIVALLRGRPRSTQGASAQTIAQRKTIRKIGLFVTNALAFIVTLMIVLPAPIWLLLIRLVSLLLRFMRAASARFRGSKKQLPIRRTLWARIRRRILARYGIADSFGQAHALRSELVRLFDPSYYGEPNIRRFVNSAIRRDDLKRGYTSSNGTKPARRELSKYHQNPKMPIYVAPIAARLDTGELEAIPQDRPIVDALLAATACVPILPAVKLGGRVYIDAFNVANEPTSALIELLRKRINPASLKVFVFPVSPLPVSQGTLNAGKDEQGPGKEHFGSVSVLKQVFRLRRLRDAGLEYRMTKLCTRLLPEGLPTRLVKVGCAGEHTFVRAEMKPIEPEKPLNLKKDLLRAKTPDDRRVAILKAVAGGCRATLERVFEDDIRKVHWNGHAADGADLVSCPDLMKLVAHRGGWEKRKDPHPGLEEICENCPKLLRRKVRDVSNGADSRPPLTWPAREPGRSGPEEKESSPAGSDGKPTVARGRSDERPTVNLVLSDKKPTITLVLSGGVFRGVFQVGVLNGLSEAKVKPNLIAGASVGSIMAGMAANLFSNDDDRLRRRKLVLLGSTFLALDRLILTDRFADAVRAFTLRAAASNFSPSDLDTAVRRYDEDGLRFGKRARSVLAGLERLFYVSPFEFRDWVKAARERNFAKMSRLLLNDLQEFLNRVGIGEELLGAEPLSLLIEQLVFDGAGGSTATFSQFEPITLIAVTTNLTRGRLDTIPSPARDASTVCLREGLLASSAFPFVFRPRKSWEIFTGDVDLDQYVDGGVMDNLPLDAVVEYLHDSSKKNPEKCPPHPKSPHLVIGASLEVEVPHLCSEEVEFIWEDWILLRARAKTLGYNRKLDTYAKAQRHFHAIYSAHGVRPDGFIPVNIEVVTVKPKWLCGTFAFHPMLGFRRKKQAESIAHGCASTLATLWRLRNDPATKDHAKPWGIEIENFDGKTIEPREGCPGTFALKPINHGEGNCWFRRDVSCPFSKKGLAGAIEGPPTVDLPEAVLREVQEIYQACGRRRTHEPR